MMVRPHKDEPLNIEYLTEADIHSHVSNSISAELIILVITGVSGGMLNCSVAVVVWCRLSFLRDRGRHFLLWNILLCDAMLLLFFITPSISQASSNKQNSSITCGQGILDKYNISAMLFEFVYSCVYITQACLALETVYRVLNPCCKYLRNSTYLTIVIICWMISVALSTVPLITGTAGTAFVYVEELKRCAPALKHGCFYPGIPFIFIQFLVVPIIPGSYFYLAFVSSKLRHRLLTSVSSDGKKRHLKPLPSISTLTDNDEELDKADKNIFTRKNVRRRQDSVLQDIRVLFASPLESTKTKSNRSSTKTTPTFPTNKLLGIQQKVIEVTKETAEFEYTEMSTVSETEELYINGDKMINDETESTSVPIGKDTLCSDESNKLSESLFIPNLEDKSYKSISSPRFTDKSAQTSFVYYTASYDEYTDSNSNSSGSQVALRSSKIEYQPDGVISIVPMSTSQWSNKINRLDAGGSAMTSERVHAAAPHTSFYRESHEKSSKASFCLQVEIPTSKRRWRTSELSNLSCPSKSPESPLQRAVSVFVRHGLLLLVITYTCSTPMALASSCLRPSLPPSFGTVAMCLYYSTCVWYPIVYFFMTSSFRKQFATVTT